MTRIIAGSVGGRRISVPPRGTRPTSDRVREALFSSLDTQLVWDEVSVLDVFAGSGALGLEARSRGAREVVLVERSAAACSVINANIKALGLSAVRLLPVDASALPARTPTPCGLVLLDPPYDDPARGIVQLLDDLAASGWIEKGALLVVERSSRDPEQPLPEGWFTSRKAYGETCLWYGRALRG